jgi:hypothetical protein
LVLHAETITGLSITSVRSDRGGEYLGQELLSFFMSKGISRQYSVPHLPQQNGRAERFNRTIMEKAQAIRLNACLPNLFWQDAAECALHLYNRQPMQRHGWKTPTEIFLGNKPDVSYFRVFGCKAYVFIPKDQRANKLAPKAEEMVFLGYEQGSKAYRFWCPTHRRIFISSTATFDEVTFPYCSKKLRPIDELSSLDKLSSIPNSSESIVPEEEAAPPDNKGTGEGRVYPDQLIQIQQHHIVPPQLPPALPQGLPPPSRPPSQGLSNGSPKDWYPRDYWDLSQAPEEFPISVHNHSYPLQLSPRKKTEETSDTIHPLSPLHPPLQRRISDTDFQLSNDRVHQHKRCLLDRYDDEGNELPDIPRNIWDNRIEDIYSEDRNIERFHRENPSYQQPGYPWLAPRRFPTETLPEFRAQPHQHRATQDIREEPCTKTRTSSRIPK